MVSTLALRSGRMVTRSMSRSPYLRRARAGVYVARTLFRHRRSIGRAARVVQRAYRRRRVRMQSDAVRGPSNQAWYLATGAVAEAGRGTSILLERKTLSTFLIQIAKPPGAVEILGQPSRNEIKLRGLKICMTLENMSFLAADSMVVHIAIVQPKGFDQVLVPLDQTSFFSRPGGGTPGQDRTENFDNFASSPAVNWDYNCNGINKQKYNIITHTKRRLISKGSVYPQGQNIWQYDKYYNMRGKRIQWDSISANYQTRPLCLLVWHERLTSDDPSSNSNLRFHLNTKSYFSNAL